MRKMNAKVMAKATVFIGCCLLLGVGCSDKSSSKTFLLPVLNAEGKTELKEVPLETLSDPSEVSGEAAIVLYNPQLNDAGVSGQATKTRLSRSGDVYIPMDYATSSALSVYHSYENIKKFEERVLPEFPMSWPRQVGLDLLFEGGFATNNAFYASLYDFTGIGPYSLGDLPLSFNSGILAHEHFHAHFSRILGDELEISAALSNPHAIEEVDGVRCGLDGLLGPFTPSTSPKFIKAVNHFVLRGWNEGLADLYAALSSGNTNFFDVSFGATGERKVDQPMFAIPTRAEMETALTQDLISYDGSCLSMEKAYGLGTQVARALYAKVKKGEFESFEGSNNKWTKEERALRFIFFKLKTLSAQLKSQADDQKLEPSSILDLIKTVEVPGQP